MTELAAERDRVGSFINESTTVGEATLARRAELEETFERFPGFLRELRSTMIELQGFSDAATPVFADLRVGAPALTRASEALGPFSDAATKSFTSLGEAAEDAGPALKKSDPGRHPDPRPRPQRRRRRSESSRRCSRRCARPAASRASWRRSSASAARSTPTTRFSHFTRAVIPTNVCFDYTSVEQSGCESKFVPTGCGLAALRADGPRCTASRSRPSDPRTGSARAPARRGRPLCQRREATAPDRRRSRTTDPETTATDDAGGRGLRHRRREPSASARCATSSTS